MAGIEFKTRTQVVADHIRTQILNGDIKAGEPLRQSALAEKLNVSRIPVREALLQLEAEGIVKFEPHKGAIATKLSAAECRELFELRALLETQVLRHAMSNQTKDDWDKAARVLEELEPLLESGSSIEQWSELNFVFHNILYKPANKPLTLELIKNLNSNSDRYVRLQLLLTDKIKRAEKEHRQLLKMCKAKDKRGACKLLKEHIEAAGESIAEVLEKQG